MATAIATAAIMLLLLLCCCCCVVIVVSLSSLLCHHHHHHCHVVIVVVATVAVVIIAAVAVIVIAAIVVVIVATIVVVVIVAAVAAAVIAIATVVMVIASSLHCGRSRTMVGVAASPSARSLKEHGKLQREIINENKKILAHTLVHMWLRDSTALSSHYGCHCHWTVAGPWRERTCTSISKEGLRMG